MPHFLSYRIQPTTKLIRPKCLFSPSPFKPQGHNFSLNPHFLFQTLSLDPLISHVTFSHCQLLPVLHSETRSFENSSNYSAFPHKNVQWFNIVESGAYFSDSFHNSPPPKWPLEGAPVIFPHNNPALVFGRCL